MSAGSWISVGLLRFGDVEVGGVAGGWRIQRGAFVPVSD